MYEFHILDSVTAPAYEQFTFPMFRPQLSAVDGSIFAIGVQSQSQPCGLILAEYSPLDRRAKICSLYVKPDHRCRGLGKSLLDRMEQTLINAGCVAVELHYTVNLMTPVLDRILAQRNWSPGSPFSLMCVIQRDLVQNAPWLNYPLPPSLTPFPWSELTLQDRETIQQQRSTLLNYPAELCPFREEHLIEPRISFGLRHQGEVVGWNIVHRIAVDTVRYSALYVRPDLQPAGRAIPLLATAVRQQIQERQVTKGIFIVLLDNAAMVNFVHRRLPPYLSEIRQTWKASKVLTSSSILATAQENLFMTMTTSMTPNIQTLTSSDTKLRLKDIIKTLPRECFQKDMRKAWTALVINVVMVGLGYVSIQAAPWFLLPFAWIFTGTALTGFFVIGHDCGHRSFAKRKWVNDLIGHILMAPMIYPFHCWRILHNHHHDHTNKMDMDNTWIPLRPEEYEQLERVKKISYQTTRGRLWWLATIIHQAMLHFNLSRYQAKDHSQVKLSIAVVVGFAAIVFPTLFLTVGVWGFVKFWLMPWLVYHFWISTFTLVHHTLPDIPFKEPEEWDAAQAQLFGTVHCDYPKWVEFLCHDINVHIPHHLCTAIPSYNLRLAHHDLTKIWGTKLRQRKFSWELMKEITDQCHLYDPDYAYRSLRSYRNQ